MYKRSVGVIDDRQQLQEVCKHCDFSFKSSNDGRCNMMIPIARWQLLQDNRKMKNKFCFHVFSSFFYSHFNSEIFLLDRTQVVESRSFTIRFKINSKCIEQCNCAYFLTIYCASQLDYNLDLSCCQNENKNLSLYQHNMCKSYQRRH